MNACSGDADFIDGVAFGSGQLYLVTGRFVESAPYVSDYTFEKIYYRSIRDRELDCLTVHDFIWRWDTDWFWCSKNVGPQVPWIRRLYGRKRLGSRTYQRVMRLNSRWRLTAMLDRARGGYSESVIQDVDIPMARAASSSTFSGKSASSPCGFVPYGAAPSLTSLRSIRCTGAHSM